MNIYGDTAVNYMKNDQGRIEKSVKPPKSRREIKELLETGAIFTLRQLAKVTGNLLSNSACERVQRRGFRIYF